jgi:hypothetical protein
MGMFGRTLNAAQPGMSRLASSLTGGHGGHGGKSGAYQDAYDNQLQLQSKLAQAMATIEAQRAAAEKDRAQTGQIDHETSVARGRGDVGDELLAGAAGTDLPTINAYRSQLRTGRRAMTGGTGDPGTDEAIGIKPDPVIDPKIEQALARYMPRYAAFRTATKDLKPDDLAKADSIYREGDLSDSVIAGALPRNTVAGAQAAAGGKPMFNSDANGAVLDLFAGSLDTNNPMAGSSIKLKTDQAGQARAAAAENYAQAGSASASAEAARALAAQRRQITAAGPGSGKAPSGYRWAAGADGEARLEPIPGGPKDSSGAAGKPLPASAAKGYLDNLQNLDRAQNALELIEGKTVGAAKGDQAATGFKGYLPNQLLNRIDPAGVDTRAAIADLGSLVIHDRSGAAVTAAEFPRLAPFIPTEKDEPATVKKKLRMFVQNYRAIVEDSKEFYRSSGYNVPDRVRKPDAPPPKQTAPGVPKPAAKPTADASGFTYLGKEE